MNRTGRTENATPGLIESAVPPWTKRDKASDAFRLTKDTFLAGRFSTGVSPRAGFSSFHVAIIKRKPRRVRDRRTVPTWCTWLRRDLSLYGCLVDRRSKAACKFRFATRGRRSGSSLRQRNEDGSDRTEERGEERRAKKGCAGGRATRPRG